MYLYFVIISRRCANIQKFERNPPVVNSESPTPQKKNISKNYKIIVSFFSSPPYHRHASYSVMGSNPPTVMDTVMPPLVTMAK